MSSAVKCLKRHCGQIILSKSLAALQSPNISIVLPCYNEEAVLAQLFQRLSAAAETWNPDYEVICVDDGSREKTWELLNHQHEKDPPWQRFFHGIPAIKQRMALFEWVKPDAE